MQFHIFIFFLGVSFMAHGKANFVSLAEHCGSIIIRADYAGTQNFTGEIIPGYLAPKAYLARPAADALCEVQTRALAQGFSLIVFDAYRPAKAVAFFQTWAKREEDHQEIKNLFYPRFSRQELFENGYIASRSGHSRGSSVDLSLVDLKTRTELDMGTRFDFFDDSSNTDSPKIDAKQRRHRQLLKSLLEGAGFVNYSKEWWHFSFRPEPHPETYFDFDVE